jgi:hypothetical protein
MIKIPIASLAVLTRYLSNIKTVQRNYGDHCDDHSIEILCQFPRLETLTLDWEYEVPIRYGGKENSSVTNQGIGHLQKYHTRNCEKRILPLIIFFDYFSLG